MVATLHQTWQGALLEKNPSSEYSFEARSSNVNTLRLRQNGRHFPDNIFKWIFLNENVWILIKISLKFVPKGRINNIPALVEIMAWRRPGNKPLSEPMMVSLLTHICITRPQWVNLIQFSTGRSKGVNIPGKWVIVEREYYILEMKSMIQKEWQTSEIDWCKNSTSVFIAHTIFRYHSNVVCRYYSTDTTNVDHFIETWAPYTNMV